MTVVLVLGAFAVAAAIVIWATRRRSSDERQSVQDYHHTLETLRHLSDRNDATRSGRPAAQVQASSDTPRSARGAARDHARVTGIPPPAHDPRAERLRRVQSRGPRSLQVPRLSSAGQGRRERPRDELRGAAATRHRRRPDSPKTSPLCQLSVPPPSRSWLRAAPSTATHERLTPAARASRDGWRL